MRKDETCSMEVVFGGINVVCWCLGGGWVAGGKSSRVEVGWVAE